jgi:hypothetical protein
MEDRYEGHFLDALDLPEGKLVPVVIEHIADPLSEKDSSGKPIKSAILAFKGKSKRLILNTTNFKNLKAMFGRDPQEWIGRTVSIQRRYLDAAHGFGVNNTLAIRIIPPAGTPILKCAANFMGSATPYGDLPRPPAKPKEPPKKESKTSPLPEDLQSWIAGFECCTTPAMCKQFRDEMLPQCSESIRGQVEEALAKHEASITETAT